MDKTLELCDVVRPFAVGGLVWIATGSCYLGFAAMLSLQSIRYSATVIAIAVESLKPKS